MRYHPKHDFTEGMVRFDRPDPRDVVLRVAKPTQAGKKPGEEMGAKKKPQRRSRYEVDI